MRSFAFFLLAILPMTFMGSCATEGHCNAVFKRASVKFPSIQNNAARRHDLIKPKLRRMAFQANTRRGNAVGKCLGKSCGGGGGGTSSAPSTHASPSAHGKTPSAPSSSSSSSGHSSPRYSASHEGSSHHGSLAHLSAHSADTPWSHGSPVSGYNPSPSHHGGSGGAHSPASSSSHSPPRYQRQSSYTATSHFESGSSRSSHSTSSDSYYHVGTGHNPSPPTTPSSHSVSQTSFASLHAAVVDLRGSHHGLSLPLLAGPPVSALALQESVTGRLHQPLVARAKQWLHHPPAAAPAPHPRAIFLSRANFTILLARAKQWLRHLAAAAPEAQAGIALLHAESTSQSRAGVGQVGPNNADMSTTWLQVRPCSLIDSRAAVNTFCLCINQAGGESICPE